MLSQNLCNNKLLITFTSILYKIHEKLLHIISLLRWSDQALQLSNNFNLLISFFTFLAFSCSVFFYLSHVVKSILSSLNLHYYL